MPGISVPFDRTNRQPIRGYCLNPECREKSDDDRFEFDVPHDRFACPKCGSDSPISVGILALVHFLVRDPNGPIAGVQSRYRFACDPKRSLLATPTNQEAASGDLRAVNCPGCLQAAAEMKATVVQGADPTFAT